jgi:hypothetical protein
VISAWLIEILGVFVRWWCLCLEINLIAAPPFALEVSCFKQLL